MNRSTSANGNATAGIQGTDGALMSHGAYRAAYDRAEIRVDIDPALAYRYLSARMLLPLLMLALMGAGMSVALTVHWFPGILLVAFGFVVPRLTRLSAPAFMMSRSLADPAVYEDLSRLGILKVVRVGN